MRWDRRSARGGAWAVVLVLALLGAWCGLAIPAHAHGALRGSSPAEGARLSTVPRELRLTFNEQVELAMARLHLIGPDGAPVALGPLRLAPDSSSVLVAGIRGGMVAGTYTVAWQVAGADGHPVRGSYRFAIAPGAHGQAHPATAPPAPPEPHRDPVSPPAGGGFDAGSPLYVAIRWLTFLGLLGVVGAVAFRFGVLPRAARRRVARGPGPEDSAADAARIGLAAAGVVAVAALLRLYAQSVALHGAGQALDARLVTGMLMSTVWGWGWLLQAAGALLALAGLHRARGAHGGTAPPASGGAGPPWQASRPEPGGVGVLALPHARVAARGERGDGAAGWALAAAGAVMLAFASALSGHAAAVPGLAAVAVLVDALHVLGAGGWLGGLLVLVAVGIPAAARAEEGERAGAAAALVDAFSPAALLFAGVVTATGAVAAGLHLGSVPALWESAYGRTLLLKLTVLAAVFATGAYNWLRVRPALGDGAGTERLRRSAAVELAMGVVVLAITAVLVATPTPVE